MSHSKSIKPTVGWFLLAVAAATVVLVFVPEVASAQSWWPFGGGDEEERPPPVPREPVYRRPSDVPAPVPQQSPPPPGAPGVPAAPGVPGAPAPAPAANYSTKSPICYQLEQRLVQEGAKGNQSRDELPRIEDEIRVIDRAFNSGQAQLDRAAMTSSCSRRRSATRRSARTWPARSMSRSGASRTSRRAVRTSSVRRADPTRTTSYASWPAITAARITSTWRGRRQRRHVGGRGIGWRQYVVAESNERRADLPHALRSSLRRLLFSRELLDLAEPFPAGCGRVLIEMRGADRVVLLPEPGRGS